MSVNRKLQQRNQRQLTDTNSIYELEGRGKRRNEEVNGGREHKMRMANDSNAMHEKKVVLELFVGKAKSRKRSAINKLLFLVSMIATKASSKR